MNCSKCGFELSDDSVFCPQCGKKVELMDEEKTKIFHADEEKTVIISDDEPEAVKVELSREEPAVQESVIKEPVVEKTVEDTNDVVTVEEPQDEAVSDESDVEEESVADVSAVAPSAESVFCPNCGEQNELGAMFCGGCGYRFGQDVFQAVNDKKADKKKGNNTKKIKVIGIIAAAVIAVCLIGFAAFKIVPKVIGGSKKANSLELYYIKDNDVYTTKKHKPKLAYEKYYDYDEDYVDGIEYGRGPQFSKDGKYMLYLKKINDDYIGDLYYQKKDKPDTEEKIASSVDTFLVLSNNTVMYQTEDSKLYIADLKGNKDKISSDVNDFVLSENEKNIVFTESDGTEKKLYSYDIGKKNADKNKLATISDLCGVSADNKTIVYMKDESLYVLSDFENEDKIDSDVAQCYTQVDGNKVTIYYAVVNDSKSISCYDLVADDMYDTDKNIKEPMIEDYQKVIVKDSFWGPRETIETDDSYYDDLQKFYEKEDRDNLRESLKSYSSNYYEMDMFCYEVGSKEPISLGKCDTYYPSEAFVYESKGLLRISKLNLEKTASVKFSDIYESGTSYGSILSDAFNNSDISLIIDNAVYPIDKGMYSDGISSYNGIGMTDNIYFVRDPETKKVYLQKAENGDIELFEVTVSNDELSYESLLEDVNSFYTVGKDGSYVAFCDVNEKGNSADLYVNGERVDSDVYPVIVSSYPKSDDVIFYIKDYDDGNGELNVYNLKSKKPVKIDSDVHISSGVAIINNNDYSYITDYSDRSREGDLMLYAGKEPKKIDSDVDGFCIDFYSFDYNRKLLTESGLMVTSSYAVPADEVEPAAEAW